MLVLTSSVMFEQSILGKKKSNILFLLVTLNCIKVTILYQSLYDFLYHNIITFRRREPVTEDDIDHEEEFYYTEVEVPLSASLSDLATPPSPSSPIGNTNNGLRNLNCQVINNSVQVSPLISNGTNGSNSTITLPASISKSKSTIVNGLPIISDHMDMARPAHENPEYVQIISRPISQQTQQSQLQQQPRRLIASTSAVNAGAGTIIIPQSHIQQQSLQSQTIYQRAPPISAASANALPIAIPVTNFAFNTTNATVSTIWKV